MLAEFNSRPARYVTADLRARTMVGIEPAVGFPNRSSVGARRRRAYNTIHNPYDSMHMIRHHHEFIFPQFHIRTQRGGLEPFLSHNPPQCVQPHLPVHDLAKQTFPPKGDHRYIIPARGGIIISLQTDGTAMQFFRHAITRIPYSAKIAPHRFMCAASGGRTCARPYSSPRPAYFASAML